MSLTLIKFEVQLVGFDTGTSGDIAEKTFLTAMQTLTPIYTYEAATFTNGVRTQQTSVYGLLTTTQAATALGFLTTLNASLGISVQAISYNVNTQP